MMFDAIENFQYEKGVEYELSVLRTTLSNPPADGSAYTYRLEHIISHKVLSANMDGIDECIMIPSKGKDFDMDFTTNAPCEIVRITGDIFGEADLLELYDTGYGNGYSLRLNIPQNTGMGRVKFLTLRFSNGDQKEIGVWQMIDEICHEQGINSVRLTVPVERRLCAYHWPGNLRELHSTLYRAIHRCSGTIRLEHLIFASAFSEGGKERDDREKLISSLIRTGGNIQHTADLLDISRPTVYRRIEKYEIDTKNLPKYAQS